MRRDKGEKVNLMLDNAFVTGHSPHNGLIRKTEEAGVDLTIPGLAV